jgi:hypothetical protein
MANDREIKIIIRADGTAAIAGINGVGTALDGVDKRTLSLSQSFQKNWAAITAGVTGAFLALQQMWEFMEASAQLEERLDNLNVLSMRYGITSDDMVAAIQRNSRGLIGLKDAADVATDALAKGFTVEQVLQMASWAETAAETSSAGMTVGQAFRDMETAITSARERGIMKLFGATIDLKSALGEQASSMSKAEKAQALFGLVAKEAAERQKVFGENTDSAADRMERFNNSLEQAKMFFGQVLLIIGQPFMAVFNAAMMMAYGLAAAIGSVVTNILWLTDTLKITEGKEKNALAWTNRMFSAAEEQGRQAAQNVKGAWDQLTSIGMLRPTGTGKGKLGGGGGVSAAEAALAEEIKLQEIINKMLAEQAKAQGEEVQETMDLDEKRANWRIAMEERAKDSAIRFAQEEAEEKQKEILETYDVWLKAELGKEAIRAEQKALLFESNMSNLQSSLNAIGGSDMSANLGMLGALSVGEDQYTKDFDRWKKLQDEKYTYLAQLGASEQEWQAAFVEEQLQRDNMLNQQKIAMAANAFGVMGNLATAMYNLTGQKSGAAFELMKSMRIGETLMNTYSSAVGAYNALSSIPYVGPALGAAAAAAAIAFGMAQVSAISSMRPGGSSRSSAGISASTAVGGRSTAVPTGSTETKASTVVNVYVYGSVVDHDQFAREIVPSITKALGDGKR